MEMSCPERTFSWSRRYTRLGEATRRLPIVASDTRSSLLRRSGERLGSQRSIRAMSNARWGCDDINEGTMHNGFGDARVNGLDQFMQTDAETEACIASLEQAQRDSLALKRSREGEPLHALEAAAAAPGVPLATSFERLRNFTLRDAKAGAAPELKLYDAMASPDRQLVKAGYFVAEGSLIIQQILQLGTTYQIASLLGTETQLQTLVPNLVEADAAYSEAARTSGGGGAGSGDGTGDAGSPPVAPPPPCVVFAGSRADVSKATGFKHSALSVLAIVRRPTAVHRPLAEWLPTLQAVPGTAVPAVLVLDGVIKPENVGALFRTALAFGACGVLLSPGCADPFYRKSIRSSMGAVFKLPFVHATRWPCELDELRTQGYQLLALHLKGSVAHYDAVPIGTESGSSRSNVDGSAGGSGHAPGIAPFAIMVGAEYEGVSDDAAQRAHARVRIPMADAMAGSLDSLNVNVAAAIVLERVFAANRHAHTALEDRKSAGDAEKELTD